MKKLMVLFIMVAMVMGFSFSVIAFEGNILEAGNQEFTIDAEVEIGPWSKIAVTQEKTWFVEDRDAEPLVGLPLTGEYGLYTNDGVVFRGLVEEAFTDGSYTPVHVEIGDSNIENNTNLGRIEIETNTPLTMELYWDTDQASWLNSPTVFGLFDRTHRILTDSQTGDPNLEIAFFDANQALMPGYLGSKKYGLGSYVGFFGDVDSGFEEGRNFNARAEGIANSAEVRIGYEQCTTRVFDLMMGIYIEKITQQEARLYEGEVGITVAALETVDPN